MSIILSGQTSADYGNPEKKQSLAGATLIFYAHSEGQIPGKPRWGFYPLGQEPITDREIGRTVVQDDGSFATKLEVAARAVLVAIAVDKLAYAPATGKHATGVLGVAALEARQIGDKQAVARLAIDLPKSAYCPLLKMLDLWLAAGRVVSGSPPLGVQGVVVTAFDRDIVQDDHLGEATTDATGTFEIFFAGSEYRKLPVLTGLLASLTSLELIGGPDLFFKVRAGAVSLLDEPAAAGRTPGRENSHNCSFNVLAVSVRDPVHPPDSGPTVWRAIGDLKIVPATIGGAIDLDADGLTANGKNAFFSTLKLNGSVFRRFTNGEAIRYRFLIREWSNPKLPSGAPAAPSAPAGRSADPVGAVPAGWTALTVQLGGSYGSIVGFTPPPPGGSGFTVTALPLLVAPDANGWIEVDQRGLGANEYYTPTGELCRFDTTQLVPAGGYAHRKFSVLLQIQTASAGFQQSPQPIHVNNDQVRLKFHLTALGSGCNPFTRSGAGTIDVNATYEVEHPYLQSYSTYVQKHDSSNHQDLSASATFSPAVPFWLDPPGVSGTATRSGYPVEPCSYEAGIVAQARLTTGEIGIVQAGPAREGFCVR